MTLREQRFNGKRLTLSKHPFTNGKAYYKLTIWLGTQKLKSFSFTKEQVAFENYERFAR